MQPFVGATTWDDLVDASATSPYEPLAVEHRCRQLATTLNAPVWTWEPGTGHWRYEAGGDGGEPGGTPPRELVAQEHQAAVTVSTDAPRQVNWLMLRLEDAVGGGWLAVAGFAAREPMPGYGPACPPEALAAWGREVLTRMRAESPRVEAIPGDAAPGRLGVALLGELIRGLRVSDAPQRYQKLVASQLLRELGADAVAWVPAQGSEAVVGAGSVPGLPAEEFRRLVSPDARADGPADRGEVELAGARRPLVVVGAEAENPAGWLVAIGKPGATPLTPRQIEHLRSIAPLIATQRLNARLYSDLKELLFGVIRSLTSAIDAKDPYTSGHSERVARIAVRLGEQLGMTPAERGDLYLMGLLHDIGKIGIADSVLKKSGRLNAEEYRQIQAHVRIGVHILDDLKKLSHLLPGVAHHHERIDGGGYPAGLAGEEIPFPARILAVADAFDAMSSNRPYRHRLSPSEIDGIFASGAGKQWDPQVVQALFACREDVERIHSKGLGESLRQVVGHTLTRATRD